MKQRCYGVGASGYPNCDGKGVKMCPEWHDFTAFHEWAMSAGYTDEHRIVRKNKNGSFEPSNCECRLKSEPKTKPPKQLTAFGETKTLTDWACDPRCPVSRAALFARIKRGWTDPDAIIVTPNYVRQKKSRACVALAQCALNFRNHPL